LLDIHLVIFTGSLWREGKKKTSSAISRYHYYHYELSLLIFLRSHFDNLK
jgi:hypothetical protein